MTDRLHADEPATSAELVGELLSRQFPHWAGLTVAAAASGGTDHAIYRLGEDLAVRLPRRASAVAQLDKERTWLPRLAPHLPVAISQPRAVGEPMLGYPWRWSVCDWIAGRNPTGDEGPALAEDLADFVGALRPLDAMAGPAPGRHNFGRGAPLATRDAATREALRACGDLIDAPAAAAAWSEALAAPAWDGPPAWLHGDLCPGNLVVEGGRLAAVIDFGGLAVGDPACDLMVAWNLLRSQDRARFEARLGADPASWARGRGWALSVALIQLPYYRETYPSLAANARATIAAVLGDS